MNKLAVLSFGAGQDSTALLHKYINEPEFRRRYAPNDFLVIMSDTGDEHPDTYKHVARMQKLCLEKGIEFVFITEDMGFHGTWKTLRKFYRRNSTVGSKGFPKSCTARLKIEPIYNFLEQWLGKKYGVSTFKKNGFIEFAKKFGKINIIIGIARGEESRVADLSKSRDKWKPLALIMKYPLIDLGLNRQDCQDYIASIGQTVPPPSNCMLCPFMSEIELLWLFRKFPKDYYEWVDIEQKKIEKNRHMEHRPVYHWARGEEKVKPTWNGKAWVHPIGKEPIGAENANYGVWGQKLLPEILKEAIAKYGHMTTEELDEYKMSHGHCVKSKY